MKKLLKLAGLLMGIVAFAPMQSFAQNNQTNILLSGAGVPQVLLNDPGTNYGQVGNSTTSGAWYLGYGTSRSSNGTAALTWDSTPAVTANAPFVMVKTQVGPATGGQVGGGVYASSSVVVSSSYEVLLSSGGNLLMTSLPNISTSTVVGGTTLLADGTYLVLTSTASQTITFQDDGTLAGSLLELGAASRAITAKKTLTLVYNAALGKWLEIAYGGN